jgi:hypothetical protein
MSTCKKNTSQITDSLAPEARQCEEKQGDSQVSTPIANSLPPKARGSGPLQDSPAAARECCSTGLMSRTVRPSRPDSPHTRKDHLIPLKEA